VERARARPRHRGNSHCFRLPIKLILVAPTTPGQKPKQSAASTATVREGGAAGDIGEDTARFQGGRGSMWGRAPSVEGRGPAPELGEDAALAGGERGGLAADSRARAMCVRRSPQQIDHLERLGEMPRGSRSDSEP